MSNSQAFDDLKALVVQQTASQSGGKGLSQPTADLLVSNLTPTTIAGAGGVGYQELGGDKAFLFIPVLDMTGSMSAFTRAVIGSYNTMLGALQKSNQASQMLVSTWLFNVRSILLHSYTLVEDAPALDGHHYHPDGQTALHDAVLDAITTVVTYGQQLRQYGARTKIVLVVFSDGQDNASAHSAQDVRRVVEDLLAQEMYTFVYIAFGGGFAHQAAANMGFPKDNVCESNASASSIRDAMEVVSSSVLRASQTIITPSGGGGFFS